MNDFCGLCGQYLSNDTQNVWVDEGEFFNEGYFVHSECAQYCQPEAYTPETCKPVTYNDSKPSVPLYGAYGANTNFKSMRQRCPKAKFQGLGKLANHRLEFRGVADIAEVEGASMDIAVWTITARCERSLDRFEGFPYLYGKKTLKVVMGDRVVDVMFYTMNSDEIASPSSSYYECLYQGYNDCDMNMDELYEADGRAMQVPQKTRYKSRLWG